MKKIKTSNHIIEILNTYETEEHIHIISELYEGGELYDFILERTLLLKHSSHTHELTHKHEYKQAHRSEKSKPKP